MSPKLTEPIFQHWTPEDVHPADAIAMPATAIDVCDRLARLEVADIEASLVPYLAAAAAELAFVAGIPWRFSADDPAVALLRLIAKVAIREPQASGPHTARLLAQLC